VSQSSDLKILALIPARGGSKRIPGKNLRSLGGRPLIEWSIAAAQGIPEIAALMVTTDDEAIARAAREAGALVPWLRPAALATDEALSVDVSLHALDWYESENGSVDGLLLLQPTSPLRTKASVTRGIALFRKHERRPVVGVSPARSHPSLCFEVKGDRMRSFLGGEGLGVRSQDLPPAHVVNGAFYLISPATLRDRRSFYGDDAVPLVMDEVDGIDIDTEHDWSMAEDAVKSRRNASP
jgi:CMP-N,N'-diacetyllegionaminic acid synthase